MALLLEQAKDIYELERSYELLKTLKTDWEELAPVLLRLRSLGTLVPIHRHHWLIGRKLLGKMTDDHQAADTHRPAPDDTAHRAQLAVKERWIKPNKQAPSLQPSNMP